MAKLPSAEDLGGLPDAGGTRPIAQIDASPIGRGVEALGQGIQQYGQGLGRLAGGFAQTAEAVDRYQFLTQSTDAYSKLIELRSQLRNDPDYSTVQQRWQDGASKIIDGSAQGINPLLRDEFRTRMGVHLAHEADNINQQAFKGAADAAGAYRMQQHEFLVAHTGPDQNDSLHTGALDAMNAKIDADVDKGFLSREQAQHEKHKLAHDVALADWLQQVRTDPERAVSILGGGGGPLVDRIVQIESGGDPNSKASTSSAYGVAQFLKTSSREHTWLDLLKEFRPDAIQGKSTAQIDALRGDPALAREMLGHLIEKNKGILENSGIAPTDGALYLSHFLGPASAIAVSKANPNTRIYDALASAVGPSFAQQMITANPTVLAGKTAGDVAQWAERKVMSAGKVVSDNPILQALNPQERYSLLNHAQAQLHAKMTDIERADRFQKLQAQKTSDQTEDGVLKDLYSDNPTVKLQDIINNDQLNRQAKERMIGVFNRAEKGEPLSQVSHATTMGLMDRLRKPDGDPQKLTDPHDIYNAYIDGKLNRADFKFLRDEADKMRTPEGDTFGKREGEFLKSVAPIINDWKRQAIDPTGKQSEYQFMLDFKRRAEEMKKAGKNPYDLMDPSKPDFMGKPEALAPYTKPFQGSLTEAAKQAPLVDQPKKTAAQRNPGETVEAYLARTGQGGMPPALPTVPLSK